MLGRARKLAPHHVDRPCYMTRRVGAHRLFANELLAAPEVDQLESIPVANLLERCANRGIYAWGESLRRTPDWPVAYLAAFGLPFLEEHVHHMNVGAPQVFKNPREHR